MMVTKDRNM